MERQFSSKFVNGGIKFNYIQNLNLIITNLDQCRCCVCLSILRDPIMCEDCEFFFCKDCYYSLKILELKNKCKSKPLRATKHLRQELSKLRITCEYCGRINIGYDNLTRHYKECDKTIKFRDELLQEIIFKDEKIIDLIKELEISQSSQNLVKPLSKSEKDIRDIILTYSLNPKQKLEMYHATIDGNISQFRILIEELKYPIFEEISTKGFYWSSIHYAMYYGKLKMIEYILKYAEKKNLLNIVMKCKTEDNRCPLLCLIRSNSVYSKEKNDILGSIITSFPINISEYIINESQKSNISECIVEIMKTKFDKQNKLMFYKYMKSLDLYYNLSDDEIREKVITRLLSNEKKQILYNSVILGDFEKFKTLVIVKKFPIFEELSVKGHFWTSLHYAMHYGKSDIILFILKNSESKGILNLIIKCKSKDNRCPLLCLIKSNSLNSENKIKILDDILSLFKKLYLSQEVYSELVKIKGSQNILRNIL